MVDLSAFAKLVSLGLTNERTNVYVLRYVTLVSDTLHIYAEYNIDSRRVLCCYEFVVDAYLADVRAAVAELSSVLDELPYIPSEPLVGYSVDRVVGEVVFP